MGARLLLRLPDDPAAPVAWLACDAGRVTASGTDALAEGALLADGRRVIAIAPGSSVLLTRAAVPSRKPQHIRRAVPFALEERLAADVASLHFAHGLREADGTVPVAVIDRALLDAWLTTLDAAGLAPEALLPEPLALPQPDGSWLLACDAERAVLRCGSHVGYALDRDEVTALLRGALAESDGPSPELTLCGVDPDDLGMLRGQFAALSTAEAPDFESLLASASAEQPAIDLLQGEFARQADGGSRWQDWRQPLALAACLLVLLFGERLWQVQQMGAESARLEAQMHAILRDSAPGITRIVDPVAQLRQQLEARRGGAGGARFLDLLATSGEALAAESNWQLASLNYRDGTLQLQLRMPGFDHFERLRGRFATLAGVEAEIGSLGSVEGEVRGSVTLRKPGA